MEEGLQYSGARLDSCPSVSPSRGWRHLCCRKGREGILTALALHRDRRVQDWMHRDRQVSWFPVTLQVMLDSSERSQGEGEGVHSTELWTAET